jgi:hypothetical protein
MGGLDTCRRSTATSCRNTRSSTSLAADSRAKAIHCIRCENLRQTRRTVTIGHPSKWARANSRLNPRGRLSGTYTVAVAATMLTLHELAGIGTTGSRSGHSTVWNASTARRPSSRSRPPSPTIPTFTSTATISPWAPRPAPGTTPVRHRRSGSEQHRPGPLVVRQISPSHDGRNDPGPNQSHDPPDRP